MLHQVPPGLLLVSQLVRSAPLITMITAAAVMTVMVALGEPLGVAVLVPAGIAVATTVGKGFVGQYGFELTRTPRGLGVRAGLLDVRSQSIPVDRVQGVVVLEPLVWRWFGWCEVQVTVAGVEQRGDDEAHLTTTLLPVIARAAGARLAVDALGGRDPGEHRAAPGPRRARRLDPVGWRVQALGVGADLLVTRRGVLTRRTDLAPRHKLQSSGLRQGPLQRRLGLATLHVHLPPGPVAPEGTHRDPAEAWELALTLARPRARRRRGVTEGTGRCGVTGSRGTYADRAQPNRPVPHQGLERKVQCNDRVLERCHAATGSASSAPAASVPSSPPPCAPPATTS